MKILEEIAIQIELHSVEGINRCFSNGVNPNDVFRNRPLIYELISEYARSSRFKYCVRAFHDAGLDFEDKALLSVLLDDQASLEQLIEVDPQLPHKRYTLPCAYTPLEEVTLLHICAEFNHVACANVLVEKGADVNAPAGIDVNGLGGQTPIFHTVNQNSNQSADMMEFLLSRSSELTTTVKGLIWGKGYTWETLIPAVNPISYAMMGLLPQMHREEGIIFQTVSTLLKHAFGINYEPKNVPNQYLRA